MFYILIAIIMVGLLIALHEFGHFAAAKLCGVKVNEFSIGMGPQILHRQGKETDYSLRLLPIGGFCAMEGEEEGESVDPRAFPNRPWWQRLIILLAGIFMNFLTGFLIILCLFSTNKYFVEPMVGDFKDWGTAQEQGLQVGDRVWSVNGHRIWTVDDISLYLNRSTSKSVDLVVERDGQRVAYPNFELSFVAASDGSAVPYLGIAPAVLESTPGLLIRNSCYQSMDFVRIVWLSLGDLLSGRAGVRDMSGIVGMVDLMGEMGEQGAQAAEANQQSPILGALLNILYFVAFISINLAMMNLLPIPALDGGQVLFMAVNGVLLAARGRKLDPKYQSWVSAAGFACLILLILAVNISDVLKLFGV